MTYISFPITGYFYFIFFPLPLTCQSGGTFICPTQGSYQFPNLLYLLTYSLTNNKYILNNKIHIYTLIYELLNRKIDKYVQSIFFLPYVWGVNIFFVNIFFYIYKKWFWLFGWQRKITCKIFFSFPQSSWLLRSMFTGWVYFPFDSCSRF